MKRVQRLKKSLLIRSMFLKYFLSTVRTPIAHGMALLLNGDGLTESIQNFEVTGFVLNLGKELFVEWDGHRHVVCDLLRKKIIRVDDSMLYTSKTVLDLNDEGERWEGEVHQGQPYGWGVLYDKEGEKKYEGFRIGDVNVHAVLLRHPNEGVPGRVVRRPALGPRHALRPQREGGVQRRVDKRRACEEEGGDHGGERGRDGVLQQGGVLGGAGELL